MGGKASALSWPRLDPIGGPGTLQARARQYLEAAQVQGLSPFTIKARYQDLSWFCRWCAERDFAGPREITKPVLERYQLHLFHHRKHDGKPISATRQMLLLVHVKGFFRWLTRQNHLPTNPASEIDLPKQPRLQLREPLSQDEVERTMAIPDVSDRLGVRDRAMLEVMYSTGVRRGELLNLRLHDVDHQRGTVFVRQGKGGKDRFVPIGERALGWVRKYLDDARPQLVTDATEPHLFLSRLGRRLSREMLTAKVRAYFTAAGVTKPGSCHLLRHTMATLMLENGADVRFIQELLGHAKLDTTQLYTHVSIAKLKEVHAETHPGRAMSFKQRAHALVERLPDNAGWKDLMYEASAIQNMEESLRDSEPGRRADAATLRQHLSLPD